MISKPHGEVSALLNDIIDEMLFAKSSRSLIFLDPLKLLRAVQQRFVHLYKFKKICCPSYLDPIYIF